MSLRGALVESPEAPDVGWLVALKRGSLQAFGRIAWKAGSKSGISFESAAIPSDWMARQSSAHQDRVDRIMSTIRSSGKLRPGREEADIAWTSPTCVHAELRCLHAELSRLGNALASDVILVATHPEIQFIDIALQRVDRITRALGKQK